MVDQNRLGLRLRQIGAHVGEMVSESLGELWGQVEEAHGPQRQRGGATVRCVGALGDRAPLLGQLGQVRHVALDETQGPAVNLGHVGCLSLLTGDELRSVRDDRRYLP